jgi:hypothetical protein
MWLPEEFTKENVEGDREAQPATDWGHHTAAQKLALAALIGSWNEGNEADRQLEEPLGQCL